ncbi:phosphatase PAP2 family protein [Geomesophilobacter sediminis]|uniref:Phosphatase PAP2 family protein n=1 Tax=Geomesophilobacter sediminis TaxID=2798584 RepID=A0A8J7JMN2_9BACT|nr:phosphatase PAP2 family protein [Geomesophilobacter sediminis]MBJ6726005.1 phosphatase PAP2 family protein [Geomesophilobacter sediminis]
MSPITMLSPAVWSANTFAAPVRSASDSEPVGAASSVAASAGDPVAADQAPSSVRRGWGWRRASLAEYVVVPVAAAGTLYFESENGQHVTARWRGHDGFDEGIRSALRLDHPGAREAARTTGDVLMGLLIAAPVVDSLATLGMRDRNWDALWQTSMINLESFTFTSLASSLMQNLIAREKPFVRNCKDINHCEETQPNRSMPSGHTAFAFTGAGLLCTNHYYQGLYASPGAERLACASGLTLATATGFVRMMADGHYATDVLAGAGIGLFSGFVLPRLLHYSWPQATAADESEPPSIFRGMNFAPEIRAGGGALVCTVPF